MRKYGRIFRLPISRGATSDDKIMSSLDGLKVDDFVLTEVGDEVQSWGTTLARFEKSSIQPAIVVLTGQAMIWQKRWT
ncbi:hypothetical protein IE4803_PD00221 (plasmid) [Rhizobium etli bv. phaseoli str. IE4803]|nr:hypothetical protein IE4803_PD00221 [Rhizobium etli bv. phaseoli str. IE4803]